MESKNLVNFDFSKLQAVILPGGFAPYQWMALTNDGLERIGQFVEKGGRCLGVCAGGYLLSREVRYDGLSYHYPTSLFDGTAEGPIPGLPIFPQVGPVRLRVTEAGRALGLEPWVSRPALFGSGPRFVRGSKVTVLLTYPDGTAAGIMRPYGKGRVIAIGAHYERPTEGDESAPPPLGCDLGFRLLLGLKNQGP